MQHHHQQNGADHRSAHPDPCEPLAHPPTIPRRPDRAKGPAATLMRVRRPEPRLAGPGGSRTRERCAMAKRGNKRRARKKKKANHGKRPNA
ncbi:hypothetical protein GCM10010371_36500 [Streptomyces subrutilus]|uniref:Uncharacterized protein n=6 Tax=Streptomyces TaxID=1883 RepID=A0A918QV81_9ACTN|nr:hypothetical protein GCM10010371_36500 [Streptomyces subrutilus]